MELSLLVDKSDPGITSMAFGRSRQIRQPFELQDFQPNVGLSVHVTEMGVQCKLTVFVFIICDGSARRKGKGLPLGANTCRTAHTGIVMQKN